MVGLSGQQPEPLAKILRPNRSVVTLLERRLLDGRDGIEAEDGPLDRLTGRCCRARPPQESEHSDPENPT